MAKEIRLATFDDSHNNEGGFGVVGVSFDDSHQNTGGVTQHPDTINIHPVIHPLRANLAGALEKVRKYVAVQVANAVRRTPSHSRVLYFHNPYTTDAGTIEAVLNNIRDDLNDLWRQDKAQSWSAKEILESFLQNEDAG